MDRRDNYRRIHISRSDNRQSSDCKFDQSEIIEYGDDGQEEEIYPPSPLSSSPPRDFDINLESQYVPIFEDDDSPNKDSNQRSSSLASSVSNESNHDYATSPVLLTSTCHIIRCPVCDKVMRTFYCAKCIQKGQFVTIDSHGIGEYKETKTMSLRRESTFEEKMDDTNKEEALEEALQIRLTTLTRRNEALKSLYNDQKSRLEETRNIMKETRRQLELEKKSNKSKEGKIELIKRFITSRKASIKKRQDSKGELMEDLKQHVSRRVFQLTTDVFPIEEVNLLEQSNSFFTMETSPLLTFSDGSHHQIEQQTAFSIVEPWLPSNGDYSSYSLWVTDNLDHIPASMSDLSERNPAFRIGAGLAYTSQLVKNLASYLDVILPAKLDLNTFNRELLDDTQFSYNVAKLNACIVHLCVSQGVDVSLINPQRTLKNLLLMLHLNISDLGRRPIVELDNEEAAKRIEEQLTPDLSLIQEDFYDFSKFIEEDDDVSDSEWEISDSINPMEMQLANEQSIQQNSYISRLPLRLLASFWSTGS